jgi:hypothetical protein
MAHITWTFTLAGQPDSGELWTEDPREARNRLTDALWAHLARIEDEERRRELKVDLTAPLGMWTQRACSARRPESYNAPGYLVRVDPKAKRGAGK